MSQDPESWETPNQKPDDIWSTIFFWAMLGLTINITALLQFPEYLEFTGAWFNFILSLFS